jgi:DNA topoisomerase-1
MEKCKICKSERLENSVYCDHHQLAYKNMEKAYIYWRKALNLSWTEYLEKIIKIKGTGKWSKEVAEDILRKA